MGKGLYLVNFDFEKPYIKMEVPSYFEKMSIYSAEDFRMILGADLVKQKHFSLSFYKNFTPEQITDEIRIFFHNFFSTFTLMEMQINKYPPQRYSVEIYSQEDEPIELYETIAELRKKISDLFPDTMLSLDT